MARPRHRHQTCLSNPLVGSLRELGDVVGGQSTTGWSLRVPSPVLSYLSYALIDRLYGPTTRRRCPVSTDYRPRTGSSRGRDPFFAHRSRDCGRARLASTILVAVGMCRGGPPAVAGPSTDAGAQRSPPVLRVRRPKSDQPERPPDDHEPRVRTIRAWTGRASISTRRTRSGRRSRDSAWGGATRCRLAGGPALPRARPGADEPAVRPPVASAQVRPSTGRPAPGSGFRSGALATQPAGKRRPAWPPGIESTSAPVAERANPPPAKTRSVPASEGRSASR